MSDINLEMRMVQLLGASHVPREIAVALAKVLADAWKDWAAGFQMHLPKAYPTLAAVPGRFAPPTPAANAPSLSQGSSSGEASLKSANELYADISSKNADFKKVYDNMIAFRGDEYLWWQVAEYTFDTFMIRSRTRS